MRLTDADVAEIRAAENVYRPADVARHYDVHRSTVTRIWAGDLRETVPPAKEPPNIETRARSKELADDIRLLLNRGMSYKEVALHFDVAVSTVYAAKGVWAG